MNCLCVLLCLFMSNIVTFASSQEHAAANYCYTDCSTWQALEQEMVEICNRIAKSDKELHVMAVAAFHLIWNMHDYALAHQVLDYLGQSVYKCPELIRYFRGKLFFFEENMQQALEEFDAACVLTGDDAKRHELGIMLKAIGSYTKTDPQGIEFDLLKAVVMNDTAHVLLKQNCVEGAISLFKHALAMQAEAYKTMQHANVIYTLRSLAHAYTEQKNFALAKETYENAVALCHIVYNNGKHPEVVATHQALHALLTDKL